ncbi:TAP-like protein-domain-containing protein [Mycena alexandri]|uniref:TAP-like protein-domain-containing protein n=1 Tax=Mycena alexandri TaxID=1745969 RepID=A0AAD6SDI5_9AGAR|nr:TAP-like protein-domain-containing protein [Mycena alexandri]
MRPSSSFGSLLPIALWLPTALAGSEFNWTTLEASTTLHWTPCYSAPLQCTLLQVPMDYSAPQNGVTASIAIVRYPSTSPKSQYRGPLLFNPGGPGGSGVDAIVASGADFVTVFGDQFDVIGFDPRGVSYSTPTISFFKTEAERRFLIPSAENVIFPSLNASSTALADTWSHMQLLSQLAAASNMNGYLQHMTTDNIARDMLQITEAFGFEKLQYWGISYGSVLGATFASLFPDKVGRLIIDGVEDMEGYYSGNLTNAMLDTDKAMQTFFDGCAKAGTEGCAFHAASASEMPAKLDALSSAIKTQPFPVIAPQSHGIVDILFLRNAILDAVYAPYDLFAPLARGLAVLATGNATLLYTQNEVPNFECDCTNSSAALPFHENNFESYMTIACGDPVPINDTVGELQTFYEATTKVSSFADLLASTRVVCAGWKIHREGRFQGPVGAKNTSFPLLLVGNTIDPVTAHASAVKTSMAFPGSVVLTQDSVGHTSLVAPSQCTFGHFKAYFVNGTLPAPGTVCSVEAELFPSGSNNITVKRAAENSEDWKVREAANNIGRVMRKILRRTL